MGQRDSEDLFVALNNQLFVFCIADQASLAGSIYDSTILKMRQERGLILLAMDDNSIVAYDYTR